MKEENQRAWDDKKKPLYKGTRHSFPVLWSALYPSQKHLTLLLCSGIIHDRLQQPEALSHAFSRSR